MSLLENNSTSESDVDGVQASIADSTAMVTRSDRVTEQNEASLEISSSPSMGLIKCPLYCRSNCAIQHHPLLVAVLNCVDTSHIELMELKLGILRNVINKYRESIVNLPGVKGEEGGSHKWSPNDPIPDVFEEYRAPLLHWVCTLGRVGAAIWLIGHNICDPYVRSERHKGETALHRALLCLQETCPVESSRKFVQLLSVMEPALSVADHNGNTPLHDCCEMLRIGLPRMEYYRECLHYMMYELNNENSTNYPNVSSIINMRNNEGNTVLHLLSESDKHLAEIKPLVQLGADYTIENNIGFTPYEVALKYKCSTTSRFYETWQGTDPQPTSFVLHGSVKSLATPNIEVKHAPGKSSTSEATSERSDSPSDDNLSIITNETSNQPSGDMHSRLTTEDLNTDDSQHANSQVTNDDQHANSQVTNDDQHANNQVTDDDQHANDQVTDDDKHANNQVTDDDQHANNQVTDEDQHANNQVTDDSQHANNQVTDDDQHANNQVTDDDQHANNQVTNDNQHANNQVTNDDQHANNQVTNDDQHANNQVTNDNQHANNQVTEQNSPVQLQKKKPGVEATKSSTWIDIQLNQQSFLNKSPGEMVQTLLSKGLESCNDLNRSKEPLPDLFPNDEDPAAQKYFEEMMNEHSTTHKVCSPKSLVDLVSRLDTSSNDDMKKLEQALQEMNPVVVTECLVSMKASGISCQPVIDFILRSRNKALNNLKLANKCVASLQQTLKHKQNRQDEIVSNIMKTFKSLSSLNKEELRHMKEFNEVSQDADAAKLNNDRIQERLTNCEAAINVLKRSYAETL